MYIKNMFLLSEGFYHINKIMCVCVCMSVTNFLCWCHDPGISRNPQTRKTRRQPCRSASSLNSIGSIFQKFLKFKNVLKVGGGVNPNWDIVQNFFDFPF